MLLKNFQRNRSASRYNLGHLAEPLALHFIEQHLLRIVDQKPLTWCFIAHILNQSVHRSVATTCIMSTLQQLILLIVRTVIFTARRWCTVVLLYRNYYRNKDPDYEDYELDRSHVTFRPNGYAVRTRSSADADNRLDAFSGQSRSTNMVPFYM